MWEEGRIVFPNWIPLTSMGRRFVFVISSSGSELAQLISQQWRVYQRFMGTTCSLVLSFLMHTHFEVCKKLIFHFVSSSLIKLMKLKFPNAVFIVFMWLGGFDNHSRSPTEIFSSLFVVNDTRAELCLWLGPQLSIIHWINSYVTQRITEIKKYRCEGQSMAHVVGHLPCTC